MLVIYPDDGWNSFLDIPTADALIATLTSGTEWSSLDDPSKEIVLVNTALYLRSIARVNPECDFATAQALVIQYDLVSGGIFTGYSFSLEKYDEVKVASIKVKYDKQKISTSISDIPLPIAGLLRDCLFDQSGQGNVTTGFEIGF